MTDDTMVEWLRSQILARKAVAEAATKGEWDSDDGGSIHVGHPTHVVVDWIVNDEDLAHVLLQQPQDTIARCEVELAILDDHHPIDGDHGSRFRSEPGQVCDVCSWATDWGISYGEYPCRTVRRIATGYRRRPGWNPDWAPEGATS